MEIVPEVYSSKEKRRKAVEKGVRSVSIMLSIGRCLDNTVNEEKEKGVEGVSVNRIMLMQSYLVITVE